MTKKKRSAWGKFLIGWTLLLLTVGLVGCFYLYSYASVYERTQPSLAMDELMAQSKDEWKQKLHDSLSAEETGFEDRRAQFDDYFEAYARNESLQYRSDLGESNSEQSVFVVYAGRKPLCRVYLRPRAGTRSFNRSEWELDRMDANEFLRGLRPVTLEIDAPADAQISLNGRLVGADCLSEEAGNAPYLTALEQRFTTPAPYVRYRVEELYGELSVEDSEARTFIQAETGDEQLVRFVLDQRGENAFRVEAPDTATVTVNGAALGPDDADPASHSLFRDLADYVGDAGWQTVAYHADGLYAEPEIRAALSDGTELTPFAGSNGTLYFLYPEDEDSPEGVREAAEEYFKAYMDYSSAGLGRGLNNLLAHILPGSELFQYVKESKEAMYFSSNTEIDFQALSFANFHMLNENCFFCTVSFQADLTASTWQDDVNYDLYTGYQLVFVKKADKWLCAAQSNLGA